MPPEIEQITRSPEVVEAMVAVVIAGLTVIAALLGLASKKLRDLTKLTAVTKEQVTNSHGTNLRDDLDEVKKSIETGFRRMDHQFGEIHDQVQRESLDRQALDERAQAEHERLWKALDKK